MKRIVLIAFICILCLSNKLFASYAPSYVIDKTTTAYLAAYSVSTQLAENQIYEDLKSMFDDYTKAAGFSTTIYTSKYLDRQALKNTSSTQLAAAIQDYYSKIYLKVKESIFPRMVTVASLMIKNPKAALYWGSYLVKTCKDIRSCCAQFETVVTNGKMSFDGLVFLDIQDWAKEYVSQTVFNGVDIKSIIESFGSLSSEDSKSTLYQQAISYTASLSGGSSSSTLSSLLTNMSSYKNISSSASSVTNSFENLSGSLDLIDAAFNTNFSSLTEVSDLFTQATYNVSSWVTDYVSEIETESTYYKQRYYILATTYTVSIGSDEELVYSNSYIQTSDYDDTPWVCLGEFTTKTAAENYQPTTTQVSSAQSKSRKYAAESKTGSQSYTVDYYNSLNDGYTYYDELTPVTTVIVENYGSTYKKYLAYTVDVYRYLPPSYTESSEEVYEEWFDSRTDNLDIFLMRLESYRQDLVNDYNTTSSFSSSDMSSSAASEDEDAISSLISSATSSVKSGSSSTYDSYDDFLDDIIESGKAGTYQWQTYSIGSDDKIPYTYTTPDQVEGMSIATFKVACSGNLDLISGSINYKCTRHKGCKSKLTDHPAYGTVGYNSGCCSMKTIFTDEDEDDAAPSGADSLLIALKVAQQTLEDLESQYTALETEIASLVTQRATASSQLNSSSPMSDEEYDNLRSQISALTIQIGELTNDLWDLEQDIEDATELIDTIKEAYKEALTEDDDDSSYEKRKRIPGIMEEDIGAFFDLTWRSDGAWYGTTFKREADLLTGTNEGALVFQAKVKMNKERQKLLGIVVHRARLGIEWTLSYEYSYETILEIMSLDGLSSEEKSEKVNKQYDKYLDKYATQSCTVTVELTEGEDTDLNDDDVQHLLWASDRLSVAKNIMSRLSEIEVELISLERFLHFQYSVTDLLKNTTLGQRLEGLVHSDTDRKTSIIETVQKAWAQRAAEKSKVTFTSTSEETE